MTFIESQLDRPVVAGQEDDSRLIARIAEGDRAALEHLYSRYERPLLRFLSSLSRERGLAEEILQDTFVAVWRSAASYAGRASVRVWLFGVARRQAHDALRRRRLVEVELDEGDGVADGAPTLEGEVLANERRADLAAAIGRLPPSQRETLALIFVEGLSYRDAAQVLGIPEGTVKSRLSHARRALRTQVLRNS